MAEENRSHEQIIRKLYDAIKENDRLKANHRRMIGLLAQTDLPVRIKTSLATIGELLCKERNDLLEKLMCKICMDVLIKVTFEPCGHCLTCESCARRLEICPFCRAAIKEKRNVKVDA